MTFQPRQYQTDSVAACLDFIKRSVDPCLIDAATGAGKSLLASMIAEAIHGLTKKRVLVLAPSAELVTQNFAKYIGFGHAASMFSASAGAKSTRHPVVFGSPLTVANSINRFCQGGPEGFALVIIDEAQGITPTVRGIVDEMRKANPNLRVVGMTATPYRLGEGYIFREHADGTINDEETAKDPYFYKCVYKVDAPSLIDQGYLTPPVIGEIGAEGYDTASLMTNALGKFNADDVDRVYHGHGRKTSAIVADFVTKAKDRKGVLIFAATVQHAQEVMASLPPSLSALVTAETKPADRKSILKRFLAQEIKYLVNVSVLTTGFDAPHVDLIAILRKTESVGLLQQIIGRGLRLFPGKAECLILDYTTNLEQHCPDGNLFAPVIKVKKGGGEDGGTTKAVCPECGYENAFSTNPKMLQYDFDSAGYCLDLDGKRVETPFGPMPRHFGRRCWGQIKTGPQGQHDRCNYRWTSKKCEECDADNDIAARYCRECKAEIVDPNDKLRVDFKAKKRDLSQWQVDEVLNYKATDAISVKGNKTVKVEWLTPYRQFTIWFSPESNNLKAQQEYANFMAATKKRSANPKSIKYRKDESGFFRIGGYNYPPDKEPG